jgi:uncharacterized protein
MKQFLLKIKPIILGALFCLTLLFPLSAQALTVEEVPNPQQLNGTWVTDMADILSQDTESQLNQMISELETNNGIEIAVVTVPETSPYPSPKAFTTKLFNHWGIGKADQDNGVLFLISTGDRRVEIETGYGIEAILPDAQVAKIIDTKITPPFKQGDFDGGTLAGTKELVVQLGGEINQTNSELNAEPSPPSSTPKINTESTSPNLRYWLENKSSLISWLVIFCVILLLSSVPIILLMAIRIDLGRKRRILVKPEGKTRTKAHPHRDRSLHCADCQQPLEQVDAIALKSKLTQPEKIAQQIGSIRFEGWRCPRCRPQLTGEGVHIFAYVSNSLDFEKCPTCQELTVTRKLETILKEPTWNQKGEQLTHKECHCCDYQEQVKEAIPCLTPPANAIFLKPNERSRVSQNLNSDFNHRPKHCTDCKYPMQLIGTDDLQSYLTPPQKVAETIGSIQLKGWQCPNCQGVHIRTYVESPRIFHNCPSCQEFTVTRTKKTVQPATTDSMGKCLIISDCQCCDYHQEQTETIPCLPTPPSRRSGDSHSSSSSYSGSYGSYSGSSDSSGSFGGGSSDGGGAGGSW